MARPKPSRPTDAELAILNVLWQHNGADRAEHGEGGAVENGDNGEVDDGRVRLDTSAFPVARAGAGDPAVDRAEGAAKSAAALPLHRRLRNPGADDARSCGDLLVAARGVRRSGGIDIAAGDFDAGGDV